jgi:DNA polymerase I
MTESQNESAPRKKRRQPNSRTVPSLVSCLEHAGLPAMDRAVKDGHRMVIGRGLEKLPTEMRQNVGTFNDLHLLGDTVPYTPDAWKNDIEDYCFDDDVMGTTALFFHWTENVLPKLNPTRKSVPLGQAILRAEYETASANIEFTGVKLDEVQLDRITRHRMTLKNRLAETVEREHRYGAFTPRKKRGMIDWRWDRKGAIALLERMGILEEWLATPGGKTPAGGVSFADPNVGGDDKKSFKVMSEKYPELKPLREVHKFHSGAKDFGFLLGPDLRNRPRQGVFWTATGRTQPFDSIWPESSWLRFLIKPAPGRAVSYIDLVAAEFGIAAGLSKDPNMMAVYASGEDVYVVLGAKLGKPRKVLKIVFLATGYGQTAIGLALVLSTRDNPVSPRIAKAIIDDINREFPVRKAWIEAVVVEAEVQGYIESLLWRLKLVPDQNPNALMNFKMQAGCADIMRLAVVYMLHAGLTLCTTVHDAVMIEADCADILAHTKIAQDCWERASRELLGGFQLRSDFKIACSCGINPCPHGQSPEDKHQGRYNDKDGLEMWDRVQVMLAEIESENSTEVIG